MFIVGIPRFVCFKQFSVPLRRIAFVNGLSKCE
jgi:hypothetical protein